MTDYYDKLKHGTLTRVYKTSTLTNTSVQTKQKNRKHIYVASNYSQNHALLYIYFPPIYSCIFY